MSSGLRFFCVQLQNAIQRMREVYSDPCERMFETVADCSKLLWMSVKKNVSINRLLKSQNKLTHTKIVLNQP